MSAFEDFVNLELPQRPVMSTAANTGYDGDPNAVGAPSKIQNSPVGTFFIQYTANKLWQKRGGPGTWEEIGGGGSGLSYLDRNLAALVTTTDGSLACSEHITQATVSSWVVVTVNGTAMSVGDGTKLLVCCYFSNDGGSTATGHGALTSADYLYWNGSIAGFQLDTLDRIDFVY
jgi:hypothetical protein